MYFEFGFAKKKTKVYRESFFTKSSSSSRPSYFLLSHSGRFFLVSCSYLFGLAFSCVFTQKNSISYPPSGSATFKYKVLLSFQPECFSDAVREHCRFLLQVNSFTLIKNILLNRHVFPSFLHSFVPSLRISVKPRKNNPVRILHCKLKLEFFVLFVCILSFSKST